MCLRFLDVRRSSGKIDRRRMGQQIHTKYHASNDVEFIPHIGVFRWDVLAPVPMFATEMNKIS